MCSYFYTFKTTTSYATTHVTPRSPYDTLIISCSFWWETHVHASKCFSRNHLLRVCLLVCPCSNYSYSVRNSSPRSTLWHIYRLIHACYRYIDSQAYRHLCLSAYKHTYVYTYNIYTHTLPHTCKCIHKYMETHIHTFLHVWLHTYTHVCLQT